MFDFSNMLGDLMKGSGLFQEQMKKMQDELGSKIVTAESGAGMVRVEINGKLEVLSVVIEDSLIEKKDKKLIENLTAAAFNDAVKKAQTMINQELMAKQAKMASTMDLSKLFGNKNER